MRLSDKKTRSRWANTLAVVTAIMLGVPNFILAFTENYPVLSKFTLILIPMGVYLLLTASTRRTGRAVLWCIPLMIVAAFEMVIIKLYGGSIIAIDMWLNVMTTNVGEASELLGNLSGVIITLCIMYGVPIIWAITLAGKGITASKITLLRMRLVGIVSVAVGSILLVAGLLFCPGFRPTRQLFPLNVACNLVDAVHRTNDTERHRVNSEDFTFNAKSLHPDSLPEIYVVIVGETSRADNWQLFGYERPTNPRLSNRDGLVFFKYALSESNTTHKSVPLLLSHLTAATFGDSISSVKSIVTAFDEAGYNTAWISNQQHNHSYIDFFSQEADHVEYLADEGLPPFDLDLVERLDNFLEANRGNKVFAVVHTYGSHFNYADRYTPEFARFKPDKAMQANASNRPTLINAYDNSIVFTDAVIDSIISTVEARHLPSAVIYLSDHGEDIFDDGTGRFLHASPSPTRWQLHVPFAVWTSDEYRAMWPEKIKALKANCNKRVSSSESAFHTTLSLAGLTTPVKLPPSDLTSTNYREPQGRYLNDYNESVTLDMALELPGFPIQ